VRSDVIERNKKIQASLDDYNKAIEQVNSGIVNHSKFSLCCMNWSYILCFKNDCYFDFKALNGQVHCISGRNGFGKTSWLETICIALFGEGFPSRANRHYSASIIYMGKPTGSRAFTSIIFELDEQKYRVTRFFERQQQNKLHSKDITLEKLNSGGGHELMHSGKLATQAWIKKNLGTVQSFLTSCIMTQSCDEDFFMRNSVMQKTYLDQQLRLESSTAFADLVKTASLAYDDISKKLNNIYEFKKAEMVSFKQSELDESVSKLDKITQELDVLDSRFKELKQGWISVNERILIKGKDVLQAEFNLVQQSECLETLIQQRAIAITNQVHVKELKALEAKYGSYKVLQIGIDRGCLEISEADELNALIKEKKPLLFKINESDIDSKVQKIMDIAELEKKLANVDVEKLVNSYPFSRAVAADSRDSFNPQCAACMSWKKKCEESEKSNITEQLAWINYYYRLEQLKREKIEARIKKEWKKFTDIATMWKILIDKNLDMTLCQDSSIYDKKIANARKRLELEAALQVIDTYVECNKIAKTREVLFVEQVECKQTIKTLLTNKKNYECTIEIINELSGYCEKFNDFSSTIKAVLSEFIKFKDWVLEEKVMPVMLSNVNKLLETMCLNHRPISLQCIFENGLNWRICDGSYAPPIEKASGFQKFMIGLAMRIVLGRLGVAGIKNTQLFIDEGFTACDTMNLCNVPDVLNKLLELYSSVIIVTHLDELKNEIRSFINIEREEGGGSRIQFGEMQKKTTRAIPCKNMDRQKVETCD
jgi:exonuclease SbcC